MKVTRDGYSRLFLFFSQAFLRATRDAVRWQNYRVADDSYQWHDRFVQVPTRAVTYYA